MSALPPEVEKALDNMRVTVEIDAALTSVTLAAEGTLEWFNISCAVRYVGGHDRTYFAYQNQKLVQVNYYDHGTDTLGTPFTCHTYAYDDDHGPPTLCIPESGPHAGRIIVFYAHHGNPCYCRRSIGTEDISAFGSAVTVSSLNISYPKPRVMANGDIWCFMRRSGPASYTASEVYHVSADGGATWGAEQVLGSQAERAFYSWVQNIGDEIHLAVALYDNAEVRFRDVYHAYTTDKAQWRNSHGDPISLPLTESNMTQVHASAAGEDSWLFDLMLAAPGDPRMVFHDDLLFVTGVPTAHYAEYAGGQWQVSNLGEAAVFMNGIEYYDLVLGARNGVNQHYPCGSCIDPENPDQLIMMLGEHGIVDVLNCTARAFLVRRTGDSWSIVTQLSDAASGFDIRPQFVRNGLPALRAVWVNVTSYNSFRDWASSLVAVAVRDV